MANFAYIACDVPEGMSLDEYRKMCAARTGKVKRRWSIGVVRGVVSK